MRLVIKELGDILSSTAKKRNINPEKNAIDGIISEDILHRYSPEVVLETALEAGCLITYCYCDKVNYKANGVWVTPEGELLQRLQDYKNVSSGLCYTCAEKQFKKEFGEDAEKLLKQFVEVNYEPFK